MLITGGAGLVGSHIADLLVKKGAREIVVLDKLLRGQPKNLSWALTHGNLRIMEGDIVDKAFLSKAMDGIDLLFHQAAIRITQCAEEPELAMNVMVNGTFNVLEAAVNAKVKKVIAASSASVYGLADRFPTPEDHHTYNNKTLYGAAKIFNENLLRCFHEMYGLDYIALRYFNVYGPRMDIHSSHIEVMIRWLDRIAKGEPPLLFGSGSQAMDFIFVEDVARANILAAESELADQVFNVGSGVETSLNELVYLILGLMESDLKPEYLPERKVNPVPRRLADKSRIQTLLGFSAQTSLEQGLKRLIQWWRKERGLALSIETIALS